MNDASHRAAPGSATAGAAAPQVSVVMANHNGAAFLEASIAAVLNQTLSDLELILIDDASQDGSLVLARDIAARDPRLRVESLETNAGPARARNRGLDLARGRWIAVVDSDDLIRPERLERLSALGDARAADIVADNLALFEHDPDQPFHLHLHGRQWRETRSVGLAEFIDSNCMYGRAPNLGFLKPLIRRDRLEAGGVRYDDQLRIGEDYDLIARMMAAGAALCVDPQPLYAYRKHGASISHRLGESHIVALLEADDRFQACFRPFPPAVVPALARRRRSLNDALAYDRAVAALKARRPVAAVRAVLGRPTAWLLLTMPLKARLKRQRRGIERGAEATAATLFAPMRCEASQPVNKTGSRELCVTGREAAPGGRHARV